MKALRDNGLTIALLAAFGLSFAGMALSGWRSHDHELIEHGRPAIGLAAYLGSGDFISAVFENWESEFLQMSAYVVLTAFLFQRGSAESRDPDEPSAGPAPGTHGLTGFLRAYSLGIVLALLFILSFVAHLGGSLEAANEDAALHGAPAASLLDHLGDAGFWFESFQNWQSEFLSTAVLVVLSIFLRFHGSPEAKPVEARASDTGA